MSCPTTSRCGLPTPVSAVPGVPVVSLASDAEPYPGAVGAGGRLKLGPTAQLPNSATAPRNATTTPPSRQLLRDPMEGRCVMSHATRDDPAVLPPNARS